MITRRHQEAAVALWRLSSSSSANNFRAHLIHKSSQIVDDDLQRQFIAMREEVLVRSHDHYRTPIRIRDRSQIDPFAKVLLHDVVDDGGVRSLSEERLLHFLFHRCEVDEDDKERVNEGPANG